MSYLLIAFFLFLIAFCFVQRKAVRVLPEATILLSLIAIWLVIYPSYATGIANWLGVGRGADLLLYICFVFGVIVIVFLGVSIKKNHDDLTDLARYVAISNARKGDK
jgi:hypothetical protein